MFWWYLGHTIDSWYFGFHACALVLSHRLTIPVTLSEPKGRKGKGKGHSESLITAKKWTPIATQKTRKPQNSASIQHKPTLTACTGKITIINPIVTSKGKFPKSADNKFLPGTVKETFTSKGTNQRREKACPEPEYLEEDTSDTVLDGKTMREIISTLPFKLYFNKNRKPEDWKDMEKVLQLHQLLKDLFQFSMDNKRFNLATHWEEFGASCQKICLKEIDFKDIMVITKGCNPTRQCRILVARATRRRETQATIQAIEEQLTQTGLLRFLQAHKEQAKSALKWLHIIQKPADQWPRVTIIHTSRKFPGEDKQRRAKTTPPSTRGRESDPMIQNLFDLVREAHKNLK
ncbi:hypothetical protein O181_064218 [Austropuccinia psidii MF-1]|uniref:Uncharacterized protein n=1 Tax=Austropuccinia psidii MF-1 TaxID=1389203 RepID=A0A9Q3ET33_9BASI|nr:hypothetical protein [Austropuccinia psidii MF-1]